MLISQKSKEIIDSCRFCWMCRHICPIGNATGQERNTARARMLALSLVERGAEPLSGVADNVYECALCEACTKECVTGWDPVRAVREVRLELALNGETPGYINAMLDNIEKTGNVFGKTEFCPDLKAAIDKHGAKEDVLFVLGKTATYKSCVNAKNAIELLEKAGLKFTVLSDEPDTGFAMSTLVGAAEETKNIMTGAAKVFSEYKTVIAYDPADARTLLRDYKEWGIDVAAQVKTFTAAVAELIKDGKLNVKNSGKKYTPQDSHWLSRSLDEVEPIRDILAACGNVSEMLLNGKDTMLGGDLIMNEYMPDVMARVASDRWINAVNMDTEILVTESPDEYELLKAQKPEGVEIKTVEEVVLECL